MIDVQKCSGRGGRLELVRSLAAAARRARGAAPRSTLEHCPLICKRRRLAVSLHERPFAEPLQR